MLKKSKKVIYLDHAATTAVDPKVLKAMQPYWSREFGNPSSLYKAGNDGKEAITQARKTIADILSCSPQEIIFTGGGTESINLAIFGIARQYELQHKKKGHLITSTIEHHAVLHSLQALQEEGWKVDYAPVDSEGFVKLDALKKLVRPDTILVSIMYANNEVGSIQPITEIGKWISGLNKARAAAKLARIYFHTDACQAAGSLPLSVADLHVDLLSLNASKIYGPKGIGLLYIKSGTPIRPIIFGGGQERNLRSGTENVPAIVGLGTALALAQKNKEKENTRLELLRNYIDDRLSKKVKGYSINGPKLAITSARKHYPINKSLQRLPNNVNISFTGVEGEALMLYLDAHNIQVSTGSACTTTSLDPSHVLEAIGIPRSEAYNAIRLTMGKATTKADLDYVIEVITQLVKKLRNTIKE